MATHAHAPVYIPVLSGLAMEVHMHLLHTRTCMSATYAMPPGACAAADDPAAAAIYSSYFAACTALQTGLCTVQSAGLDQQPTNDTFVT